MKHKERTEKLKLQIDLSEKTKDYNLGTSLRNYIDPRIIKAWTDEVGAEWEKMYTSALQKKFLWVQNEKLNWSEIAKAIKKSIKIPYVAFNFPIFSHILCRGSSAWLECQFAW